MTGWWQRLRPAPIPDVPRPTDPRLLFVHIPKTAGISLFSALERWAGPEHAVRFPNDGRDLPDYLALSDERVAALRLISGHLAFHDLERRPMPGWSPITVIREPVARTVSLYAFVRSNPRHAWYERAQAMSLEAFVDWLDELPNNHDQQCRFIVKGGEAEAAYRVLQERFLLAASLEQMAAFGAALSALLGTRLHIRHRNRTAAPIDPATITDAARRRILALSPHDAELHRRVAADGLVGTAVLAVADGAGVSR